MTESFFYKRHKLNYCINAHNTRGSLTERTVEVPLLEYALNNVDDPLEIGCVSPYYWKTNHEIYDLTDPNPACKNINAKDINFKNRNVISISTIEHFDIDNYNISSVNYIDPIQYLQLLVHNTNKHLITFPLGYNSRLTSYILEETNFPISFMARSDDGWVETDKHGLTPAQLDYNRYIWYANSIAIIENIFV